MTMTTNKIITCQSEGDSLLTWIEQQISNGAVRFLLRQRSTDGMEHMVQEFVVQASPDCAAALSESIELQIQSDSQYLPAGVVYIVHACRGTDLIGRRFIRQPGADVFYARMDPGIGDICAQLMRHNEAMMRLGTGQFLDVMNHYKDQVSTQARQIKGYEDQKFAVLELLEALSMENHKREMERERIAQEAKRNEFLRDKLDMYLPVILSKVFPNAAKGEILGGELLRQLLKSLSETQLDTIASNLTTDQAALLGQIYTCYAERDIAKEQRANTDTNERRPS